MSTPKLPELPELTFEERRHIYRLRGFEIPSVSTIMQPLSEDVYGSINEDVLSKAADRGTAVHNAIDNYVKFGVEDIPPEHMGYFQAFLKWYEDYDVKPYETEYRAYHKGLLYAGTLDMMASVKGEDTLVDFKTTASINEMLWRVQTEAYNKALASHYFQICFFKKMVVQLKKDGDYNVVSFKAVDTDSWKVFTALLTVRNFKQKYS